MVFAVSGSKPLAEEDVYEALGEQWWRHYRFPSTGHIPPQDTGREGLDTPRGFSAWVQVGKTEYSDPPLSQLSNCLPLSYSGKGKDSLDFYFHL